MTLGTDHNFIASVVIGAHGVENLYQYVDLRLNACYFGNLVVSLQGALISIVGIVDRTHPVSFEVGLNYRH